MATQLTLTGSVIETGVQKRLSGATIRLEKASGETIQSVESNANGYFAFDPIDEPDLSPEQSSYELKLYAYYKEGRQQEPTPQSVTINKGETHKAVTVEMVNRGPVSKLAGGLFLAALVIVLGLLVFWYYKLHSPNTAEEQTEIDTEVVDMLADNLLNRITADSIKVSAFVVKDTVISANDSAFVSNELQQMKINAHELFKASQVDSSVQSLIGLNLVDVENAVKRKKKEEIQAALISTKANVRKVPTFKASWFWETVPDIYYEVLFWSLFATLIRLIGNTSYYVSRNIFFSDSIYHKGPLLFTIPLVALLIVFIISFFKISVSIGGTSFVFDFSNPFVLIILASLIGLAPWKAWEFMYGVADLLFVSLKSWLSLDKPGDEESEGEETDSAAPTAPEAATETIVEPDAQNTATATVDNNQTTTTTTDNQDAADDGTTVVQP